MTPEASLDRAVAHLDDALESLTFEQFQWAFEETWSGLAWCMNALAPTPADALPLAPRGALSTPGTLASTLGDNPEAERLGGSLVRRMEALRGSLGEVDSRDALVPLGERISSIVFEAWAVHDACAEHLGLFESGPSAAVASADGVRRAERGSAPETPTEWRVPRRTALRILAAGTLFPLAACADGRPARAPVAAAAPAPAAPKVEEPPPVAIRAVTPLNGQQWPTTDPFLFCAWHVDDYPAGNEGMGPAASLAGRPLGRDFEGRDNWRMYHGEEVPGFPRHPHRGFETVTVVRTGLLDHADSLGATARYGGGDVQWLTAGGGIQHAEMFPLLQADRDNPLELFQIWLNLPARDKMVPAYFTMLWSERIPRVAVPDGAGRMVEVTIAAGSWGDQRPPPPPPSSWASRPESDLAIWTIRMEAGATFTLPPVGKGTERSLYAHRGAGLKVLDRDVPNLHRVELQGNGSVALVAGPREVELLLLQARPIAEPIARRGPFVMNTNDEIRQAYADYRQTGFGGWPWPKDGPVHDRTRTRFARHIDGRFEEPT